MNAPFTPSFHLSVRHTHSERASCQGHGQAYDPGQSTQDTRQKAQYAHNGSPSSTSTTGSRRGNCSQPCSPAQTMAPSGLHGHSTQSGQNLNVVLHTRIGIDDDGKKEVQHAPATRTAKAEASQCPRRSWISGYARFVGILVTNASITKRSEYDTKMQ
jgi:hypothetical protein